VDNLILYLGDFGAIAIMAIAAIGSAAGTGTAGMAAVGAWKKCYAQNKPAPFILVGFAGSPLTQTIYGFILMQTLMSEAAAVPEKFMQRLAAGLVGGAAIAMSAYFQGKGAAAACDAFGETGKGVANYFIVLGITETVALFVMVFLLVAF
jgi:V/A-type H+-transporting ATPase subunit K